MPRKKKEPPFNESWLQKTVIERAQELGWKVMHPLPGQTRGGWATVTQGDGKGFPDLTLVRERIVYAELKADLKYLSQDQKLWRDWILRAGGEWYCWKTLNWIDGTIEQILTVEHPSVSEFTEITDPEKFKRLVKACSGDESQAHRIYSALSAFYP